MAEELGVSITPVREAIFRLVSDRALEMKTATAFHVAEISSKDLDHIQTVRMLLEGHAAAEAANCATPSQIQALEETHLKFQDVAQQDHVKAAALNRKFHFDLMQISNNPVLFGTVENMWLIMGPLLRIFHEDTPITEQTSTKHLHFDVLAALKNKDSDGARQALQDDIMQGLNLSAWIEAKENQT